MRSLFTVESEIQYFQVSRFIILRDVMKLNNFKVISIRPFSTLHRAFLFVPFRHRFIFQFFKTFVDIQIGIYFTFVALANMKNCNWYPFRLNPAFENKIGTSHGFMDNLFINLFNCRWLTLRRLEHSELSYDF